MDEGSKELVDARDWVPGTDVNWFLLSLSAGSQRAYPACALHAFVLAHVVLPPYWPPDAVF